MFTASRDLQKFSDTLYAACANLQRGDVLTHETVYGVLRVGPHQGHWDQCVGKVRRRLQNERGIATWPIHGVGYRLCSESEQLNEVPLRRQQRAKRQVRRGLASVESLPTEGLSEHDLRVRSVRIQQMRRMDQDISSEMRTISALKVKIEGNPRVRPVVLNFEK